MSKHTHLRVGGKADLFYITENSGDLVKAVRLARSFKVPVTVLGGGNGVVIGDQGVRGLVIQNNSERIQIRPKRSFFDFFRKKEVTKAEVVIDSGVEIGVAVEKLLDLGILGFEKMASLKGTVGAMVAGGEGKEASAKVSVLDEHGGVKSVSAGKEVKGVVIDATYYLGYGKAEDAKRQADKERKKLREWQKPAGKMFEEINETEQIALGYPTRDPGYIVGEVLNMKGFRVGGMKVSGTNSNKIINEGRGSAADYVALVEEIKTRAREAIGIELLEKMVRIGEF